MVSVADARAQCVDFSSGLLGRGKRLRKIDVAAGDKGMCDADESSEYV